MNIGFIGLGSMGKAMATVLLAAGHQLVLYNRTRSSAEALVPAGAKVADTPAAAARGAEVVITMLSNDAAVEAVTLGKDGLSAGLAQAATHISMSSISIDLSQRLAKSHADAGVGYIAAPVFGRPDAAANGKLWIVAGGDTAQIDRYRTLLAAMSRGLSIVGSEPWQANLVKITGNFTLAAMMGNPRRILCPDAKIGDRPNRLSPHHQSSISVACVRELRYSDRRKPLRASTICPPVRSQRHAAGTASCGWGSGTHAARQLGSRSVIIGGRTRLC